MSNQTNIYDFEQLFTLIFVFVTNGKGAFIKGNSTIKLVLDKIELDVLYPFHFNCYISIS